MLPLSFYAVRFHQLICYAVVAVIVVFFCSIYFWQRTRRTPLTQVRDLTLLVLYILVNKCPSVSFVHGCLVHCLFSNSIPFLVFDFCCRNFPPSVAFFSSSQRPSIVVIVFVCFPPHFCHKRNNVHITLSFFSFSCSLPLTEVLRFTQSGRPVSTLL